MVGEYVAQIRDIYKQHPELQGKGRTLHAHTAAEQEEPNNYGGQGEFELPANHVAAIVVPAGGSCCENCKYVDPDNHACTNEYYIKWNGGDGALPEEPLDSICSDWYEPAG